LTEDKIFFDMLKKSQALNEAEAKPDFLDLDKDGDKKEPMKKAAKEAKHEKSIEEGDVVAGGGLPRLLQNSLKYGVYGVDFETISDMEKGGDMISRQLKVAAKKIGGGDDNVAVMYEEPYEVDWYDVLTVAKEWGGKFIEIKDEYGSAIVFGI